ncbi:sensor histidine kinase [Paraburkholderia sp. BL10I2N1]|uniref:sensor histidine kinase n=1 Tax=Paraburkholderia sp. BL10I2N1 TaxID=1938796 RepID=UPI002442EDF9|nr:sensor histidine kinase [Paraburkholderia sp. BL10I2N1]
MTRTEQPEASGSLRESYLLLQEATTRRETACEEERKRIAREMHDELGQQLTALRLNISALRIEFGADNPELLDRLQGLLSLCDQTMQVVRHAIVSMRPAALDAGIIPALELLATTFSRDNNIACRLQTPKVTVVLDEEREAAMFRIAQEALTNAARHAHANQVTVSLSQADSFWLLEVHDDGCGFDSESARPRSFGLLGMRERALILGGQLSITSAQGKGTSIVARIPVETPFPEASIGIT